MRTSRQPICLFILTGLIATGCSNQPKLVPVSGKVTLNGKPLRNVRVDFHPDPDAGTRGKGSTATTDAEGNFSLTCEENSPGAIVGHHRVIITDLDLFGTEFVGRKDYRTESPGGPKETPKKARFSDTYSNLANTPFKKEVAPGMEPVTFDLKK